VPSCETAFHRVIKEIKIPPPLFYHGATGHHPEPADASWQYPYYLVRRFRKTQKTRHCYIHVWTSECPSPCSTANPTGNIFYFIYFYLYRFGIAILILVKVGRNDKQFTGRSKYIYDLSPLLVFVTEMDCASVANELSLEKELSIIMMGCKLLILTSKFFICQMIHNGLALKILKFTLKQFLHVSVQSTIIRERIIWAC